MKIIALAAVAFMIVGCNITKKTSNPMDSKMESIDIITQSTWELVTLEGQSVTQNSSNKKIHFQLDKADGMINGFSGCNTFRGSYMLEDGNRISFSQLASTRMACPDNEVNESALLNVFNITDNYTIKGDELTLNVGRRAPLAVFEAADMQ